MGLKVDLACGQNKREGFVGMDIAKCEGVDIVRDVLDFPWPFDDGEVEELHSSHFVEHIGYDEGRDLLAFMNEAYRVAAPGATFTIIHPFCKSVRAFQDPTHRRFIPAETWSYFDAEWRKVQRLDHYPITCDWKVVNIVGGFNYPWNTRSAEAQQFATQHYFDVVADLTVTLQANKG